ncbi:hypothetical protein GCM10027277_51130 [Pseudoduganella ginsengisoli]
MQPARVQRMRERAHDVLLADERFKVPGTVFASEDLIRHAGNFTTHGSADFGNVA